MKLGCRKLLQNNSVWAVLLVIAKSAIGFFIVPFITNAVGIEAYGYIALANTMITYIDIISISFNYFAQRYISVSFHRGDKQSSNIYYSSIILADLVLCLSTSIPLGYFVIKLDHFLNIQVGYCLDVKILFGLVIIRYYLSLISSSFEIGSFIRDRYDTVAKSKIVASIAQVAVLLGLYGGLENRVYFVGIAALTYDMLNLLILKLLKNKYAPELVVNRRDFSIAAFRELLSKGIWIAINNIGNILNNGLDLLATNLMVSETMMGQISIAKMVSSVNYTVVTGVAESFKARQLKLYSHGETEKLLRELKYSMKISGMFFLVFSGVIISCGEGLVQLWIGGDNSKTIYYLLIICVCSDFIPSIMKPLYYVYTLTTRMRIPCFITIGMGLMNVISMFFLLKFSSYGGYVVVLTTLVINTFHIFDTPLYSAHCLGVKLLLFYDVVAVYSIAFAANTLVCGLLFRTIWVTHSWATLIIKMLISCLVSIIVSMSIMLNRNDLGKMVKREVCIPKRMI